MSIPIRPAVRGGNPEPVGGAVYTVGDHRVASSIRQRAEARAKPPGQGRCTASTDAFLPWGKDSGTS